MDLNKLLRPHIINITPYSSARDEFSGQGEIYLDANENAMGSTAGNEYHRYPDPHQKKLKAKISEIKKINKANIFIGNGSDEPIDLIIRAFCRPGIDHIITTPPTYGMYGVSAAINDVENREVLLTSDFQLDTDGILRSTNANSKLVFLCNPNNPTGNSLDPVNIVKIIEGFPGIVVLDEAYIDFSSRPGFLSQIGKYPNLIILQTLSKAWGLASLRLGMAFASTEIIAILNRIKPPYNINGATQEMVCQALSKVNEKESKVREIQKQKPFLEKELLKNKYVTRVYPSDANFLLVKMTEIRSVFNFLIDQKIIVRDRSNVPLCDGCLRVTIGTKEENLKLLNALNSL